MMKYIYFFKNHYKIKFHLYDHRGVHKHIFEIMNKIFILFYINTIKIHYFGGSSHRRSLATFFFGTAAIYYCSAETAFGHRVFAIEKTIKNISQAKDRAQVQVTLRKPIYNVFMRFALVRLRLVSQTFKLLLFKILLSQDLKSLRRLWKTLFGQLRLDVSIEKNSLE